MIGLVSVSDEEEGVDWESTLWTNIRMRRRKTNLLRGTTIE